VWDREPLGTNPDPDPGSSPGPRIASKARKKDKMIKFNLEALSQFANDPSEMDGRALAGLARAGLIERKEGAVAYEGAKLTKGAKTLLRAGELGWSE